MAMSPQLAKLVAALRKADATTTNPHTRPEDPQVLREAYRAHMHALADYLEALDAADYSPCFAAPALEEIAYVVPHEHGVAAKPVGAPESAPEAPAATETQPGTDEALLEAFAAALAGLPTAEGTGPERTIVPGVKARFYLAEGADEVGPAVFLVDRETETAYSFGDPATGRAYVESALEQIARGDLEPETDLSGKPASGFGLELDK